MPVSFTISGLKELQQRMADAPAKMQQKIGAVMGIAAGDIAGEAKTRAPGNIGFLRNEIGSTQTGPLQYEVFSGAEYSAYVEFGTRGQVSIPAGLETYAAQFIGSPGSSSLSAKAAIFEWCRNKGIEQSAWYPIFISIMVKGTRPQPFMFPAFFRYEKLIISDVKDVLDNLI